MRVSRGRYTVNEVEERTKVSGSTLRQWERRYGFPKPERSTSGYRLYCDEDVRLIEAMKRFIAEGVPASRAAELVRQLEPAPARPSTLSELQAGLVGALVQLDEAAAERLLGEAHALHPVETVLELVRKTMVEIGTLWHRGAVSTTTEHFASAYLHGRLRALLSVMGNPKRAPMVIIACAPSEQHELGALCLAVLLRRAGYRVLYVGANTPLKELREMADELAPVGVMISASSPEAFRQLQAGRRYLQGIAPVLAFGGGFFNRQPELAQSLGGTFLAEEGALAVERFNDLVLEKGVMRA
ncbi:regulatory protein MerR [Truepera radiovictrix DSM 17093]|uniref:Regulatory protein MerR n=1 Tax=Truepera radiovictrix (strain DSM 17093 / CIP 108686 / LMG 22925 / RQ-24) TaxID=649638 RepID=D7CUI3_TRURR|nr:regulatory protein MerR [Truepera radiovictrix DSM 17093]